MKYLLYCLLAFQPLCLLAQKDLIKKDFQIIDISQKQMRLFHAFKNSDSLKRSKIFADSLYAPYQEFWSGYVGNESQFVRWVNNKVLPNLNGYEKRNQQINGNQLLVQFDEVKAKMKQLTGYSPVGTWYILYGPGWTDLGGLTGGTMLIDLSHERNSSNDNIMMMFPHEITHQIYSNVNRHHDTTALGSIIGEGFAVYMNQLYWKDKFSLTANLGFTEAELATADKQAGIIKKFFDDNKLVTGRDEINKFRSRGYRLNEELPGAIGYYIGYRIIEQYVKKHGKDAWKDVFTKSPKEILSLSGY